MRTRYIALAILLTSVLAQAANYLIANAAGKTVLLFRLRTVFLQGGRQIGAAVHAMIRCRGEPS